MPTGPYKAELLSKTPAKRSVRRYVQLIWTHPWGKVHKAIQAHENDKYLLLENGSPEGQKGSI